MTSFPKTYAEQNVHKVYGGKKVNSCNSGPGEVTLSKSGRCFFYSRDVCTDVSFRNLSGLYRATHSLKAAVELGSQNKTHLQRQSPSSGKKRCISCLHFYTAALSLQEELSVVFAVLPSPISSSPQLCKVGLGSENTGHPVSFFVEWGFEHDSFPFYCDTLNTAPCSVWSSWQ